MTGNAYLRARLEELLGQYEKARHDLAEVRRRSRTTRGTAATTDGSVRVSVDANGKPTAIELDAKAYRRYSPSQLATQLMDLFAEANRDVTARMADVMAPFLPEGVDYAQVVSGGIDPQSWQPARPLDDESFDEWRARFSGRPESLPEDERR